MLIRFKSLSEDVVLLEFFKKCAHREEKLHQQLQSLVAQTNRQESNFQAMGRQNQQTQLALNEANERIRQLEGLLRESHQTHAALGSQLQEERHNAKGIEEALKSEYAQHAKTGKNMERYWSALKNISEFLIMGQLASSEVKEAIMTDLLGGKHIGSLMIEVDEKNEYIEKLEDVYKSEKEEMELIIAGLRAKEQAVADFDAQLDHDPDFEMTDPRQLNSIRRRTRSDRKGGKANARKG